MPFLPGNPGGPGNPLGAMQEKFRSVLSHCFKKKHFRDLMALMYKQAMEGDHFSQRYIADRLLGKESQHLSVEGLQKLFGLSPEEADKV